MMPFMDDLEFDIPAHAVGSEGAPGHHLRTVLVRTQMAVRGGAELDALIDGALADFAARGPSSRPPAELFGHGTPWSSDLSQALDLLPADCNFALGHRDGICWAWIQPNDDWEPGENESRHDHPDGSGLVVAYTAALALISAVLNLHGIRTQTSGCDPVPPAGHLCGC
jgi:hypothetical protein